MVAALQKKISESATARWIVLALVAFTMLCAYFITDVMAPLKPMLEQQMGWSSSDYGFFTSAYGWFNVFLLMLIFGGMILDKMGVRFTGLMSTVIMVIGVGIKYWAIASDFGGASVTIFGSVISSQVLWAAIGYAIFGVGIEIAGITVSKIIVKWFKGKEIPPTTLENTLITDQLIKPDASRIYNDPARLVWIGVPLIRTGEGVTARNNTGEKQFRFGEAEAEFLMELTLRCADLSRKVTLADAKQLYGKYSPEPFVVFYHSKQWDQLRKYGLLQI